MKVLPLYCNEHVVAVITAILCLSAVTTGRSTHYQPALAAQQLVATGSMTSCPASAPIQQWMIYTVSLSWPLNCPAAALNSLLSIAAGAATVQMLTVINGSLQYVFNRYTVNPGPAAACIVDCCRGSYGPDVDLINPSLQSVFDRYTVDPARILL
jgi:hypothetical protein